MNITGIIPARMASSRFPGKPLAGIRGIPMILHVYFRSRMCALMDDVYVATCDDEIRECVEAAGGKAVMTKDTHERASDRAAEAVLKIEKETGRRQDIVAMIQGDEPMVYPEMIEQAIRPMIEDAGILVTNLMAPIKSVREFEDPNTVKVTVDLNNDALYFSREPIPSRKKGAQDIPMRGTGRCPLPCKQVCVIPFRRDFLMQFTALTPTPLEVIESVDMMRVLEHGFKVRMVPTDSDTCSVDNEADRLKVEKLMAQDALFEKYGALTVNRRILSGDVDSPPLVGGDRGGGS